MGLEELLNAVPDYARDLKINLPNVLKQAELTTQQLWGTAVASALAGRNPQVRRAILSEADKQLSPAALNAAKGAAAVMGMNNVFYRFQHLASNRKYSELPGRLRMQMIRMHGIEQVDFELWCTAVSAINGCAACVDSHERVVREKGLTEEAVLAAVRIASVIQALSVVFDAEC